MLLHDPRSMAQLRLTTRLNAFVRRCRGVINSLRPFSTSGARLTLLAVFLASPWSMAEGPPTPSDPMRESPGSIASEPLIPYRKHADELLTISDPAGHEQPITNEIGWRQRREHILASFQAVAGILPPADAMPPLDLRVIDSIETELYRRLKVTFVGISVEERVPAYLFIPKSLSPGERRPAILALHQTTSVGKAEPAGVGGDLNLQYGLELAARGYVVLCPDYPSFGEYPFDFAKSRFPSGTLQGMVNHRRAVDLLASLPEVDAARVGVIGHSLGGHNAIFIAAFDERLKVAVSSCGWTPAHDYYGGKLAGWASDVYMPRVRSEYRLDPDQLPFDLPELIAAIAPRGFYSCSPLRDENFDHRGVIKGIAAVRPVYQLLGVESRLVLDSPDEEHRFPVESRRAAYRFIDEQLDYSPPPYSDFVTELPRISPREPAAAIESFELPSGWKLELVAAEPQITSPVALAYDERGGLYVVEMRDYSEQADERLGRIRLLHDTNGDGFFDQSTVFADDLSWPTAIATYDGGVFVGAAPDIWYLKDHDGDGVADERRRVFTGFGRGNVQGLLNSFHWGLDNRIYGSSSTAGGDIARIDAPGAATIAVAGRDFSFDPRALTLRAETGGGQHGMTFDDWGRRFVSANSDHFQAVLVDDRYLQSPGAVFDAPLRQSIAVDGPQAEVFRISPVEPWREVRTRLRTTGQAPGPIEGGGRAAGYFTGATGGTIYRGDAWPNEFLGQAFIGDVGSNIVHRKIVHEQGVTFAAQRADEEREFVASRDNWFRPVQFANAPDGTLQIIDMYREVIEHPASLPPQIKPFVDLTSGRDRGRIYRLLWGDSPPRRRFQLDHLTTAELVSLLEHPNGWHRDTAARLLFERQDATAIPLLRSLAKTTAHPLARMHALYALAGYHAIVADDLAPRLADEHPRVREHAIRLSERCDITGAIRSALDDRSRDEDLRVQFQLALTLANRTEDKRFPALAELAARSGDDPWMIAAVRLAAGGHLVELFERALDLPMRAGVSRAAMIEKLAAGVAERGSREDLHRLARRASQLSQTTSDIAEPSLRGMLIGAARGRRRSLLSSALVEYQELRQRSRALIHAARETAMSPEAAVDARRGAMEVTEAAEFDDNRSFVVDMLAASLPEELQVTTVRMLGRYETDDIPDILFDAWPGLSAAARSEASFVLFSRRDWADRAFRAIDTRRVSARDFDPRATALLGDQADEMQARRGDGTRADVVLSHQTALERKGDANQGRSLFRQHCAACHRMENVGHEIGPNLSAFASRGAAAILTNVLDPNREVGPQYVNQIVVTQDGRSHSGILISQSAASITLKRGDSITETIPREEIEELRSTGQSIMPEGFETSLGEQGLADLISYILSGK